MEAAGLGVGVVWCAPLDPLCREAEGLVSVVEAEPETFWAPRADGSGIRSFLEPALAHLNQPKLLHGVGAPLGGGCVASDAHVAALARDIAVARPPFVSQHLSFTHFRPPDGGPPAFAGFLLPPLQSDEGVAQAAANIRAHREALGGLPVAVETPVNYLPPAPGEWPDGAFVAAVAEEADCGILLDLHNVLCNARNGRQGVTEVCADLPLERVWEIHLAGGTAVGGVFTDAHSGLIEDELMELVAEVVPRLPHLQAIIFEIMPEHVAAVGLGPIARQLGRLKDIWSTRGAPGASAGAARPRPVANPQFAPQAWEAMLGCACAGLPEPAVGEGLAAWREAAAPRLDLYRLMVGEGRASAVTAAAPKTTRLLLKSRGPAEARRRLADFWRAAPPAAIAVDEARGFMRFLLATDPALPDLAACVAADEALLAAF